MRARDPAEKKKNEIKKMNADCIWMHYGFMKPTLTQKTPVKDLHKNLQSKNEISLLGSIIIYFPHNFFAYLTKH